MRKFNLVKLSILKILLIGGIGLQTFSCTTEIESPEKILSQMQNSSSSSEQALLSSSSGKAESSSSGDVSSSSAQSSSSGVGSSSSEAVSSSSVDGSSSSCVIQDGVSGTLGYEGQIYKTIGIDCQVWMAENLNYNADGSRCYGDNTGGDSQNRCGTYGRLYNWATAMKLDLSCNSSSDCEVQPEHQGICPSGWHIPSDDDWSQLFGYVGGSSVAGKHLKAKTGWNSSGNGLDTYGFSALPGGYGDSGGSFSNVGSYGSWWSSSEGSSNYAYSRYMYYNVEGASWRNYDKMDLFSVRCVQD